jgi:anaerobic magnesium-protoporphyrin IX monomethyl ester cyclase
MSSQHTMPRGRTAVLFSDIRGRDGFSTVFFPLSTLAVATALSQAGILVKVIDAQIDRRWREQLEDLLPTALMLGVSALTGPSLATALDAVEIARRNSSVPIVWGGYHASHNYEAIFRENLADFVVCGPGEKGAIALARALTDWGKEIPPYVLSGIPGLVYAGADGSVHANRRDKIENMAQIPEIDYTLVDAEAYLSRNGRILHTITSYGCPHRCTFCVEPTQSLRRWRGRGAIEIVDEMERLSGRYRPSLISIHDPNFSSNPQRVADVIWEISRRGQAFPILCDMRARDVTRLAELIDLKGLREAGFETIFLGLESGSDRILRLLQKGSTADDAWAACQLLDEAGVETKTSFMHDIPGETDHDTDLTFELLDKLGTLRLNRQRHHFFTPYPATKIFEDLVHLNQVGNQWTQRDWASTGTYWGSDIWPGSAERRASTLARLNRLREQFPHALEESGLPQLERRVPVQG